MWGQFGRNISTSISHYITVFRLYYIILYDIIVLYYIVLYYIYTYVCVFSLSLKTSQTGGNMTFPFCWTNYTRPRQEYSKMIKDPIWSNVTWSDMVSFAPSKGKLPWNSHSSPLVTTATTLSQSWSPWIRTTGYTDIPIPTSIQRIYVILCGGTGKSHRETRADHGPSLKSAFRMQNQGYCQAHGKSHV